MYVNNLVGDIRGNPRNFYRYGNSKLKTRFQELRKGIKTEITKQHNLYVNNLVGDIRANPRNFYRYVNSQRKNNQGIPPLKKRDGSGLAESESDQAEEFNGQFTDVFTQSRFNEAPLLDRSAQQMNDISVSTEGITKLLNSLNPSKAMSPDELHPRILKELAAELGPVFTHLLNSSHWTLVKSQRNGLWQTSVPYLRRVTGL